MPRSVNRGIGFVMCGSARRLTLLGSGETLPAAAGVRGCVLSYSCKMSCILGGGAPIQDASTRFQGTLPLLEQGVQDDFVLHEALLEGGGVPTPKQDILHESV